MKSVMLSIQPKWVEKIVTGKKTAEVRKSRPKIETPFKCYIYETKGQYIKFIHGAHIKYGYGCGKVIGDFVCDWITEITPSCDIDGCVNKYMHGYPAILGDCDCLSFDEMKAYLVNKKGYAWHISDLKIYDKPKELSEFIKPCTMMFKYCEECEFYSTHTGCCTNFVTRPPESWCYVEGLE